MEVGKIAIIIIITILVLIIVQYLLHQSVRNRILQGIPRIPGMPDIPLPFGRKSPIYEKRGRYGTCSSWIGASFDYQGRRDNDCKSGYSPSYSPSYSPHAKGYQTCVCKTIDKEPKDPEFDYGCADRWQGQCTQDRRALGGYKVPNPEKQIIHYGKYGICTCDGLDKCKGSYKATCVGGNACYCGKWNDRGCEDVRNSMNSPSGVIGNGFCRRTYDGGVTVEDKPGEDRMVIWPEDSSPEG